MWIVYVDWSPPRLLGWSPFCYGGYLVSSYILFLLTFAANVVVMVLMFLFLWCLENFVDVVCLRWLVLCYLGWNIFVMMIVNIITRQGTNVSSLPLWNETNTQNSVT
jgi:hypothetical protein